MVKTIKTERGWAIVHWSGQIYLETARYKRKEAIAAFLKMFVPRGRTWKMESQYGVHKAIKVEMTLDSTTKHS